MIMTTTQTLCITGRIPAKVISPDHAIQRGNSYEDCRKYDYKPQVNICSIS